MGGKDPLEPEELLAQAEEFLVTVPEAARILQEAHPDEAWYAVKVRRMVRSGDIAAVRVGGEHSEGYHLVDRRQLESLGGGGGDESASG